MVRSSRLRILLIVLVLVICWSEHASAGMLAVTLADIPRAVREMTRFGLTGLARQRLEVISFFSVGLLVCTGVIQWVWNGLRKDFPLLPRLSYARALGVIVLWGLLFILVLTMISGARELMTPGAWEKKGLTYRLKPPPRIQAEITARVEAIRRLGEHLVDYAKLNAGRLPTAEQTLEMDPALWLVPTRSGGRYEYVEGLVLSDEARGQPRAVLAYEPASVGSDRLVLMTDQHVVWLPASEILRDPSSRMP